LAAEPIPTTSSSGDSIGPDEDELTGQKMLVEDEQKERIL
jgi:hypothetical protein